MHLAAGRSRQTTDQEIFERRTRMGAATLPLADNVVALCDQVCGAPEVEVRKRRPEVRHERLDVVTAAARFVQRILQQHVRCSNLVDDGKLDVLASEIGEPAADNGLVVLFLAH